MLSRNDIVSKVCVVSVDDMLMLVLDVIVSGDEATVKLVSCNAEIEDDGAG